MTKQKDTKERIDSILLKAGVERNEIEATREQILAKVCKVMMNLEEAEKHWNYTEQILQLMLELCHYLYVQAMIHGAKHEAQKHEEQKPS